MSEPYNTDKYIKHKENKFKLTPYFELDTDSLRNPKGNRVYWVGFEEEPEIRIQVTEPLIHQSFEDVMVIILKKLTSMVEENKDRGRLFKNGGYEDGV
jgi:hypothetical protein